MEYQFYKANPEPIMKERALNLCGSKKGLCPTGKFKMVREREEMDLHSETYFKLQKYFDTHGAAVGDLVFMDCCYMVVKKMYNANHDRVTLWLAWSCNSDQDEPEAPEGFRHPYP